MYLVVEWVTISAPHSKGRQLTGVAKVLSTISGTPWLWAARAKSSISSTSEGRIGDGLPENRLGIGPECGSEILRRQSGETKGEIHAHLLHGHGKADCRCRRRWTQQETTWSPAGAILKTAKKLAAWPLEVGASPLCRPPERQSWLPPYRWSGSGASCRNSRLPPDQRASPCPRRSHTGRLCSG